MAIYRSIQMTFWTDAKVVDNFTPEDRYFYLYLLTNPHTNLCGCYEISMKQISDETGYTKEVVERLFERMERVHNVIRVSNQTKEVLILNWSKFNWTSSEKFRKPLEKEINSVKSIDFQGFLKSLYNGDDTVSIPYPYGSDTTVTVTVSDTVSDSFTDKGLDTKDIRVKKDNNRYFPNDELLETTFSDFRKMRKEMKKPMTARAIALMLTKLQRLSSDPLEQVKILEQSILHGWTDIYEVNGSQGRKQTTADSIADRWANVH